MLSSPTSQTPPDQPPGPLPAKSVPPLRDARPAPRLPALTVPHWLPRDQPFAYQLRSTLHLLFSHSLARSPCPAPPPSGPPCGQTCLHWNIPFSLPASVQPSQYHTSSRKSSGLLSSDPCWKPFQTKLQTPQLSHTTWLAGALLLPGCFYSFPVFQAVRNTFLPSKNTYTYVHMHVCVRGHTHTHP